MGALATGLLGLDLADYRSHALHSSDSTYIETNCHSDILIELLRACRREPLAAIGATGRMDFESDQRTFFNPPLQDIAALSGIDTSARVTQHFGDGAWEPTISSRGFAQYVALDIPGFTVADSWFHLAPGQSSTITLQSTDPQRAPSGTVRALNGLQSVRVAAGESPR